MENRSLQEKYMRRKPFVSGQKILQYIEVYSRFTTVFCLRYSPEKPRTVQYRTIQPFLTAVYLLPAQLLLSLKRSSRPEAFCEKGILRNLAKGNRKTPVPESPLAATFSPLVKFYCYVT